jgi:hypothetical protein
MHALALDPHDAQTHHWYASALWSQNRIPESRVEIDRARSLDPTSLSILVHHAVFWQPAEPLESARTLRDIVRSNPSYSAPYLYLAQIDELDHDYHGFLRDQRSLVLLSKSSTGQIDQLQRVLELQGPAAMLRAWATHMASLANARQASDYAAAQSAANAAEYPQALQWLQKSYRDHEAEFLTIPLDDSFVPLHSNPAFQDLLAKRSRPTVQ